MPAFKDYPADYSQSQLFPHNVFDLLPDDHDCFVYRDLFEQLDTSEVDARYSRRGQRAYAPLVKADFRYDEERDGFHCPGGQFLALRRVDAKGRREYRGRSSRL